MSLVVSYEGDLLSRLSQLVESAYHASTETNDTEEMSYFQMLTATKGIRDAFQLFDAQDITKCSCHLLLPYLRPGSVVVGIEEYRERLADLMVAIRWNNILESVPELVLLQRSHVAVENALHLQSRLGSVIRFDGKLVGVHYFATDADGFVKIMADGPLRKDVVAMVAAIDLAQVDYGVLLYEQADACKAFEIRSHQSIYNSVVERCKKMQRCLLTGQLPPCPHYPSGEQKETSHDECK